MTWPMNGSIASMVRKMARILGTKTRVISWICVSACNSAIATPTASPTSISGLATLISAQMASRATSSTSAPLTFPSRSAWSVRSSDRHPHDLLIGGDHAVAHADEGLHRHFGLGDGGDHVDEVGLAGGMGERRLVGPGTGGGDVIERLLHQRREILARLGRLCGAAGRRSDGVARRRRIGVRRHG